MTGGLMSTEEHDLLVTVLATRDPALIAIAKSLLDDADIQYLAKGEATNALFGGALTGFNPTASLVQIQVHRDDAADARELLKDLLTPGSADQQ